MLASACETIQGLLHHDMYEAVLATKASHKHLILSVCTVLRHCFRCMTIILEFIASAKMTSTRALSMLSPANPAGCCSVQPAETCTCVRVIWPELCHTTTWLVAEKLQGVLGAAFIWSGTFLTVYTQRHMCAQHAIEECNLPNHA